MARKNYHELMSEYCKIIRQENKRKRSRRDPASYFINLDMIRETKRRSYGSERLFYVADDGSLMQRTDEFR